jgi:signal transduction histidine kinase
MLRRLSIKALVFAMLSGLVVLSVSGGALTFWYAARMDGTLSGILDDSFPAYQAAEELRTALVMQKGLVTYYFLDGNPQWLELLSGSERDFERWLSRARRSSSGDDLARGLLEQIESGYLRYNKSREEVIAHYREGRREQGMSLHEGVREQFHHLLGLCDQYEDIHESSIARAREEARRGARVIKAAAVSAMPVLAGLGVVLAVFVARQLLLPIRRLAREMDGRAGGPLLVNGVKDLGTKVHNLLEDVDETQIKLRETREQIRQSEKWALTGKLAAGVAHSIRNPLTSVKIRLFSLARSLDPAAEQKEDLDVIAEEIKHIDTIARNFLEFSRPPKLKMQQVSPSDVVDLTVQLVRHRLESSSTTLEVVRNGRLPRITIDPDQLKEVLANLIFNACEAMGMGGRITVTEEQGVADPLGKVVVLRVADSGPGIPAEIQDSVFQPFYSSKEEGTGLGLSIAKRIVEEHGGWLTLRSKPGEGAMFIITLPTREETQWLRY